jgi:hypothetical protein
MTAPISISLVQSRSYLYGDTARLEVAGSAQPEAIRIAGDTRGLEGFGHGSFGRGRFGRGRGSGFGSGAFGRGVFGQGASLVGRSTQARFVAGDYAMRVRAVDALGNAGDWSASATRPHRPDPPAPTALAITGGALTATWSDP